MAQDRGFIRRKEVAFYTGALHFQVSAESLKRGAYFAAGVSPNAREWKANDAGRWSAK
jgi:hypothetical protein